jgi:hypothetical protein
MLKSFSVRRECTVAALEPEQEDLLAQLVEAHRAVPRAARDKFLVASSNDGSWVLHRALRGWNLRTNEADVEILALAGFLHLDHSNGFAITPDGLEHYEVRRQALSGTMDQVASEITSYLDADRFRSEHPGAFAKWSAASHDLWSSDSEKELTAIGHSAREAMWAFASEWLAKHPIAGVDSNPEHDVSRIRDLLDAAGPTLGSTEAPFLDALLAYWGTVSDLAQRQEHGSHREGEPLNWEDARRLVFQLAVVMYEMDRALSRAFSAG